MKIVVVDDEMSALHVFLSEVISAQDVDYKFFRDNPDEICQYVLNNNVDAAFLDINMPNANGIELAEQLVHIDPAIKIVFITGLTLAENDLPEIVRNHTLGFLYKPYNAEALERILGRIGRKHKVLVATMFGTFDCFADGKPVKFPSAKSKELFALLLAYRGKTLTMADAISQLWQNVDGEKAKSLYRDAVWRLRKTLNDLDINCVEFQRAALTPVISLLQCDYWEYLLFGKGDFAGEFCKNYEWSAEYLPYLHQLQHDADNPTND